MREVSKFNSIVGRIIKDAIYPSFAIGRPYHVVPIGIMKENKTDDVSWMLSDAIHLLQSKRPYGAILLLLCAVDAIAARRFPGMGVRERFEDYLKTQMRRPERPQIHNIFVPPRNELLTFEYILYKYLRNPVVHEGAKLELDSPAGCAVQIDWGELSRGVKVDGVHSRVILGGELIIDILLDAVMEDQKSGTTSDDTERR